MLHVSYAKSLLSSTEARYIRQIFLEENRAKDEKEHLFKLAEQQKRGEGAAWDMLEL